MAAATTVTIVGQKFTEADIMTQLYKQLLEKEGFETEVKNLGARDIYLDPLQKGDVQVSADYLSSMTEALNRKANGDDADPVASPDVEETLDAAEDARGQVRHHPAGAGQGRGRELLRRHQGLRREEQPHDTERPRQARQAGRARRRLRLLPSDRTAARAWRASTASS